MLAAGEDLVEATDMHRVSGLETWFSLPGRTAPGAAEMEDVPGLGDGVLPAEPDAVR